MKLQKYDLFLDIAVGKRIPRSIDYQENFNHKPILNCEGYKPEIEEEQPVGTFVVDVKHSQNKK